MLHAEEFDHEVEKITPTNTGSDSSSVENDNEASFVSAESVHLEDPIPPPQTRLATKPSTRISKELPDPPSTTSHEQSSLLPPSAPRLERPSSISSLDIPFGQPGIEIGDMKSALDRLVIDARELTKESIQPTDLPNNSMNSEGREAERRLSHSVFDESLVTETDMDEEEDTRELIFPAPPPITAGSYRLSRSMDVETSNCIPQAESHAIPDPVERAISAGSVERHEADESEEEEEERAPTPVPSVKRDLQSPQLPELRRFSFETDLGFGSTMDIDLTPSTTTLSNIPPQAFTPTIASPSTPKSPRGAIAAREAAIAQRRKELREAEEDIQKKVQLENEAFERERQEKWQQRQDMVKRGEGRPSGRRSLSTGDVHEPVKTLVQSPSLDLLNVSISEVDDEGLHLDFDDREVGSRKEGPKDVRSSF